MAFEWDEAKNAANVLKHGVRFEDAVRIFDGRVVTKIDARRDYGEARVISIGMIGAASILVVVHTDRHGRTRIISARLASQRERREYGQTL